MLKKRQKPEVRRQKSEKIDNKKESLTKFAKSKSDKINSINNILFRGNTAEEGVLVFAPEIHNV
jgi:hypothetical protein